MTARAPELIRLEGLTSKDDITGRWRIEAAKPNNWRQYWDIFLDEARRTGATEMAYLGCGDEAHAYELYRDGKPMQVVIRIQAGGVPTRGFDGILPFYSDELFECPGDPHPPWTHETRLKSPFGVRITVMPKLWQIPNNPGIVDTIVVDEEAAIAHEDIYGDSGAKLLGQIQRKLNDQGKGSIDMVHGLANIGFYCAPGEQYVPMSFDPGSDHMHRYPATVKIGGKWDRQRTEGWLTLAREGEAKWMDRDLWRNIRREIAADAERLYAGEPTVYSQRVAQTKVDIPASIADMVSPAVPVRSQGAKR